MTPRTAPRKTVSTAPPGTTADLHVERESHPWAAYIATHPVRKESAGFRAAKKAAQAILRTLDAKTDPYGAGPWEMHHGGSLWVLAGKRWRLYRARAGIEWSMQFCADPLLVDRLRQDAADLVNAFPDTLPALAALGYAPAPDLLTTPITDADGVAAWTDSLFNATVPLKVGDHTGVLPAAAGEHHYPMPVKAADFFKYADFTLWVTLPDGTHAAVAPVDHRGSGETRVQLMYARHGTEAGDALATAQRLHRVVILPGDSGEARQAFAQQPG